MVRNWGGAVRAVLEVLITKRRPTKWEWRVCDRYGTTIMGGFESTRPAANYRGNRASSYCLSAGVSFPGAVTGALLRRAFSLLFPDGGPLWRQSQAMGNELQPPK